MAKKLFALEDLENEISDVEMEVSPEEGEIADVQAEVESEMGDIISTGDGIEDAAEAGDQLEEVGELVEGAEEGLDPVAAEAVRIAVEAICSRLGADPKQMGMYHLYATENFQSSSSRKANTQIALEGIKDFLKELWEKIKNAVKSLWKKVTDFWAKHLSSLGRIKKALEAMKKKVASSKGTFKGTSILDKAPSGLVSAFAGKKTINAEVVTSYIASHSAVSGVFQGVINKTSDTQLIVIKNSEAGAGVFKNIRDKVAGEAAEFGSKDAPLIGGVYYKYEFEVEEDKVTTNVTTETIDDVETELKMIAGGKEDLSSVIAKTLVVIDNTIKVKGSMDKAGKEFDNHTSAIEQLINKREGNKAFEGQTAQEVTKELRDKLNVIRSVNVGLLTFSTKLVSADVKLAKAVLGFCATSMKLYKD
ncbi:hypothetical protein AGENTSMITH_33 [Bacillus phage vB_BspM_AgentSmith]|nr:hypothetical protein AGENTSMITH_33 [Bacillus phage vB_BspM_AgentSmith]